MLNNYTMDPNEVQFDDKYVVFNPLQNEDEYLATYESIKKLGQKDPILMLNGKCIDGRHRTKVAKELMVNVECVDVDPKMSEEELILLCNTNVTSGRDYDAAQKAIQALNLTKNYNIKAKEAALMFKINKRLVSYAATIAGYGRQDILDTLMRNKDKRIKLKGMERASRSLELIAKFVKAESEEQSIVVDDSERIQWKPDSVIKTETGKAWYYEQLDLVKAVGNIHYEKLLAEMANMKYKLVTNE